MSTRYKKARRQQSQAILKRLLPESPDYEVTGYEQSPTPQRAGLRTGLPQPDTTRITDANSPDLPDTQSTVTDYQEGPYARRKHSLEYREYIDSKAWARKRAQYWSEAGRSCQRCGSDRNLHVHHHTYERLGNERMSDLIGLCASCHEEVHKYAFAHPALSLTVATEHVCTLTLHAQIIQPKKPPRDTSKDIHFHRGLSPEMQALKDRPRKKSPKKKKGGPTYPHAGRAVPKASGDVEIVDGVVIRHVQQLVAR